MDEPDFDPEDLLNELWGVSPEQGNAESRKPFLNSMCCLLNVPPPLPLCEDCGRPVLPPLEPRRTLGSGADVVIIDEAAHIDPVLFMRTIVPPLFDNYGRFWNWLHPQGDQGTT